MTTKQAFIKLLDSAELIKQLNINESTLRTLKKRIRDNKLISDRSMEKYLLMAGAIKKPESWKFK